MDLKPGSRWRSAVCEGEFVIVRPPKAAALLACGGVPMIPHASARPEGGSVAEPHSAGVQAGKRFADAETGLEVLCTKAGAGSLSIDGRAIGWTAAKKLPASD